MTHDIHLAGFTNRPEALEARDVYAAAVCAIKAQNLVGIFGPKYTGKHGGWTLYVRRHAGVTDADIANAREHLAWYLRVRPDEHRKDCRHRASYPDLAIARREAQMVFTRWRYVVWPCWHEPCGMYHLTSRMPDTRAS